MATLDETIHAILEQAADAGQPDMRHAELDALTRRLTAGIAPLLLAADPVTRGRAGVDKRQLRDPAQPTSRERQVAAMVADGATSEEIAVLFEVKADTVRGHISRLQRRWGVRTSAGMVDAGFVRGVLALPRPLVRLAVVPSARELEVLGLLASGLSADEVGELLGLAPTTVHGHCQRLFLKLGARSKAHAVAQAWRSGLLPAVTGSGAASGGPGAPSRPRTASAPPTASYGPPEAAGAVRP